MVNPSRGDRVCGVVGLEVRIAVDREGIEDKLEDSAGYAINDEECTEIRRRRH